MLLFAPGRLRLLQLQHPRRGSRALNIKDGRLSVDDSVEDDAENVGRSFADWKLGFIFVVKFMCGVPSRAAEVPKWLEFFMWLDGEFPGDPARRLDYAEELMLEYKDSADWLSNAKSDPTLLLKFSAFTSPQPTRRGPPSASSSSGLSSSSSSGGPAGPPTKRVRFDPSTKWPPAGQPLSMIHPGHTCLSRISRDKSCPKEAKGEVCKFIHKCVYCSMDHPASTCPLCPK